MVEVRNMVKDIVRSGTTVFFSSHLLAEVQQVCDHVTVIHLGVMRYSGTLEGISSNVVARRRVVIELEKPVDAVLASLKTMKFATVEANMNTYTLHLDTREDVRAEVSRAVTSAGGVIVRMQEEGGGLEDAFLSLVGKEGMA
jgi:ABC-2 type transport system ATP-binding protein